MIEIACLILKSILVVGGVFGLCAAVTAGLYAGLRFAIVVFGPVVLLRVRDGRLESCAVVRKDIE